MSATFNPTAFQHYFLFNIGGETYIPPVIKVMHPSNFTTKIKFLDDMKVPFTNRCSRYSESLLITEEQYKTATHIIINHLEQSDMSSDQAILVFLPGIYEIESLHSILQNFPQLSSENCFICKLHSSLPLNEQKIAFTLTDKPKILSSNIAECSITLPGVSVVIDFCLTKISSISNESTLSSLKLEWASKQNCTQRAGRTVRKSF
jgi:ATP-dependent RNA helicase TDRD9